jgi:DNA-binding FadR family transcriptional regulator
MKPESFRRVTAAIEGQAQWSGARVIAERAGVSYTTARGVLLKLELQGVVECQSGKGWRVVSI